MGAAQLRVRLFAQEKGGSSRLFFGHNTTTLVGRARYTVQVQGEEPYVPG